MFLVFYYHSNTSQTLIFSSVIIKINNQPHNVVGLFSLFLVIMIVCVEDIKIITLLKRLEQNYTHVILINVIKTFFDYTVECLLIKIHKVHKTT